MVTTPDPLVSDAPLIVYLDIKSPYAYLATFPTMDLEDRLGMEFDWRPLTLDIPSYLGSAKLDEAGKVAEQNRTEEQWRAVKYAYADCRRYAALRQRTLRGTVKIWDTSLVHMGMMWAKRQGQRTLRQFIQRVYEPFWRREFDADDVTEVEATLQASGADLVGFRSFVEGEGREEHDQMQREMFDAGLFGVPSFVLNGEVFFGREHLPRIEWLLQGGDSGTAPDIAYRCFRDKASEAAIHASLPSGAEVLHAIDFSQAESYLAHQPTREVSEKFGFTVRYRPFASRGPMQVEGGERTQRHLELRARHTARQLALAACSQGVDLERGCGESEAAHCGLLWLAESRPDLVSSYVEKAFGAYWKQGEDLEDAGVVDGLLRAIGAPASEFSVEAVRPRLRKARHDLAAQGIVDAPAYVVGGEVFLGRAHLPLILGRLSGGDTRAL